MEDEKMETSKTERDWLRNISEKRTTPTEKKRRRKPKLKLPRKSRQPRRTDRSMVMVSVTLLAWTV